jgi:FkbM family methyltransferase
MSSYRVKAHHPHWRGTLQLSSQDNSVRHVETGSKGTYRVAGDTLTVEWDDYKPDLFIKDKFGLYVHENVRPINVNTLRTVEISGQIREISEISVPVSARGDEVSLRLGTTDIDTFTQIFIENEYDSQVLPDNAQFIVDLGANVGYATVFFALKYPQAQILAIEPDSENFASLTKNTLRLGNRIQRELAAVWTKDGHLTLQTEDRYGIPMGAWGVRVSDDAGAPGSTVPCLKLATLYQRCNLSKVDILKIDIEGAEKELFTVDPHVWLAKTELIII